MAFEGVVRWPAARGERLIRRPGLRFVPLVKIVSTTVGDVNAPYPLDRDKGQFKADRPNHLLVSDFTGWGEVALTMLATLKKRVHDWISRFGH